MLRSAGELARQCGSTPILWRGIRAKHSSFVALVTNDREAYRGKLDLFTKTVIDLLDLGSQPIFCSQDPSQASFFGNLYLVVPASGDFAWSHEVRDLVAMGAGWTVKKDGTKVHRRESAVIADAKKVAEKYSRSQKPPTSQVDGEIVVATDSYYAISVRGILEYLKPSKFAKIKRLEDLVTYDDVVQLITDVISYSKWREGRVPK